MIAKKLIPRRTRKKPELKHQYTHECSSKGVRKTETPPSPCQSLLTSDIRYHLHFHLHCRVVQARRAFIMKCICSVCKDKYFYLHRKYLYLLFHTKETEDFAKERGFIVKNNLLLTSVIAIIFQ